MKKRNILIVFTVIIICLLIWLYNREPNKYYGFSTAGALVTQKEITDDYMYYITVEHFGDSTDIIKETKVRVIEENLWNLIEINRYYMINISKKNYEDFVLTQIEINDKFGEIYGELFKK